MIICDLPAVIDGDGIRCANVGEVRLLGIDAPEYRSSSPCRRGYRDRICDDRAAERAKANLRRGLSLGPIRLEPVTRDRYGRMIAVAFAGSTNLSCWQLRAGVARYVARYDNGRRIAGACPAR